MKEISNSNNFQLTVQEILQRSQAEDTYKSAEKAAQYLINLVYLAGLSIQQLQEVSCENYKEKLDSLFNSSAKSGFRSREFWYEFEKLCFEGDVMIVGATFDSIELAIALMNIKIEGQIIKIIEAAKTILEVRFPLNLSDYTGCLLCSESGQVDIILSHPTKGKITFSCITIDEKSCKVSGSGSHHGGLVF